MLKANEPHPEPVEETVEPGTPRCIRCSRPIEPGLAALGSTSCHDCRPRTPVLRAT